MLLTIISLISLYQKTFSPDHSIFRSFHTYGYCRFFPTCSDYAKHACMRYGCMRGSVLAVRRLFRCHPWSKGGINFVI